MRIGKGNRATRLVSLAIDEMAFLGKAVVTRSVHGRECLEAILKQESVHCALSSSKWKKAVFGPAIEPAAQLAEVNIAELAALL